LKRGDAKVARVQRRKGDKRENEEGRVSERRCAYAE